MEAELYSIQTRDLRVSHQTPLAVDRVSVTAVCAVTTLFQAWNQSTRTGFQSELASNSDSRVGDTTGPPRRQNEDLRHVMAAWDCLAPGGTLVAVVSPGWERPANETELLLFRRWFAEVHARQEELPEETFIESAPPMQSRLICAVRQPLTH